MDRNLKKSGILFISERSVWGMLAETYVLHHYPDATCVLWDHGDPAPLVVSGWHGDWILSFKSDLILPTAILRQASKGAINFHPAPPKYRGLGGYRLAIHNGDAEYGVTCHHMTEQVDFGPIIDVRRFSICPGETPSSLRHRAAVESLSQFCEIVRFLVTVAHLPSSIEQWNSTFLLWPEVVKLTGGNESSLRQNVEAAPVL